MKAAADNILFPALEQTFMAVVLVDECNRVLFFNEAAEKLWGYSRDEVLGRDMNILIPWASEACSWGLCPPSPRRGKFPGCRDES